jgi:fatty acid photodecarboxylase
VQAEGKLDRWPTGITFHLVAVRPQSRGSVRLASTDATQRPAINLAYCSDAGDVDRSTLRAGLKLSRKLANTSAWSPYISKELHPGVNVSDDADVDDYIARTLHSANALVGTCAMGARAAGGVVDPASFAVHGVKGLRVVDASVIPKIPGGQTGAPVVMVAERAAAMMTEGRTSVLGAAPSAKQLAVA